MILFFAIVVCMCSCNNRYVETTKSTYDCNDDGYIYDYRSFKAEKHIKNPNGLLHYYVVDTIEMKNPIVVQFDVNSSFIMEKSVFNKIEPTYDNYIDNDFVYLYADEAVAGSVRSIYPLRDSIVCNYSSRIDFFDYENESGVHAFGALPERLTTLDYKRVHKNIYINNKAISVSTWNNPPKRFVALLIRGDSYREISYCRIQYETTGFIPIRPLPLTNRYSYYKICHS